MSKTKCSKCGLVTFTPELVCSRCGQYVGPRVTRIGPREAARKSSMLYTLLFLAIVMYGVNYFYQGVKTTMAEIDANNAKYVREITPANASKVTRAESDNRRVEPYKNAIRNSQGIVESQKRVAQAEEIMRGSSASNVTSKN